ncbi:MAG: response regulator [Burkholderiales bacterium]|nr:response regulator [Burkholderiales bacterium]
MSKTVLVVDDSGSFRMVVKVGLQRAGYQVLEARNGRHATELLDGRDIHLVVCDLNMPEMDGLAFARYLRSTSYSATPLVMLTTESQSSKEKDTDGLNISNWITKPFLPSTLQETVSRLCPL